MEWVVIACLLVILIVLIAIHRLSLRDSRGLQNQMVMVLLSEDMYAAQRKRLLDFVSSVDAENATDLYGQTSQAATNLAVKGADAALTADLLWEAKRKMGHRPAGSAGV